MSTSTNVSSAVAQLNAQTAAANVSGQASHLSSMWQHVTKKFPELRNATQYYAYDVAKASRQVVGAAYTTVNAVLVNEGAPGAPPLSPATENPSQPKEKDPPVESEAHYVPMPSTISRGLVVRRVELQHVPGGAIYLIVMLEKVGFAAFEVTERGVYEVFTDLSSFTDDVVGVQVMEGNEMLVLRRNPPAINRIALPSGLVVAHKELQNCANPDALLRIGDTHIAITNNDFYQISVRRADNLEEQTTLYADANLVTASSQSMLAYCTLPDESISHTKYSAKSAESTLQTVARNVSSLSKLLWGSTPQAAAQVQPLGAVSIYDVVSNEVIGAFSPHNHVIASLTFNGDGTLLATASHVGTFINIFQILREVPHGCALYTTSVVLLARLHRGVTRAEICSLAFSPLNNFLAVGSAVGTCHIFPLGKIHPERGSSSSANSTAPQVTAIARVRSAPCGGPVNPKLIFSSKVSSDTTSVMMVIVSAFGVVTTVRCNANGISDHYSCYLDHFKGPRDREVAVEPVLSTKEISALHCNAQVELETYERCSPLENFWFGGGSPPHPEEQTLNGDWDDCVELRQSPKNVALASPGAAESDEFSDAE